MREPVQDHHLRAGIFDAMRGVKLPSNGRALSEDDRRVLSEAIFAAFNKNTWEVTCQPFNGFSYLGTPSSSKTGSENGA